MVWTSEGRSGAEAVVISGGGCVRRLSRELFHGFSVKGEALSNGLVVPVKAGEGVGGKTSL